MKLRADFNWKLTLFVVLMLPVLLRLGFWQMQRAEEKQQMLDNFRALTGQPALEYLQVPAAVMENYLNVTVAGEFQPSLFLLDNQIYRGKFGYEVIQPFRLDDGSVMLVSRGWVEGSLDRRQLPFIGLPAGRVNLEGYLYQPAATYGLDADAWSTAQWPKVIQTPDVEKMYKALGDDAKIRHPFLLRLHEGQPHLLMPHWQIINVQPEKHTAYAMQWFGMAVLLVILFVMASIRREAGKPGE